MHGIELRIFFSVNECYLRNTVEVICDKHFFNCGDYTYVCTRVSREKEKFYEFSFDVAALLIQTFTFVISLAFLNKKQGRKKRGKLY